MPIFDDQSAKRISRVVKEYEKRILGNPVGGRINPNTFTADEIRSARAPSTGIPARSGLVCGSATCRFYRDEPTNYQLGDESETVYNDYRVAVANNGEIRIRRYGGYWWVLTEECNTTQAPSTGGTSSSTSTAMVSGGLLTNKNTINGSGLGGGSINGLFDGPPGGNPPSGGGAGSSSGQTTTGPPPPP